MSDPTASSLVYQLGRLILDLLELLVQVGRKNVRSIFNLVRPVPSNFDNIEFEQARLSRSYRKLEGGLTVDACEEGWMDGSMFG